MKKFSLIIFSLLLISLFGLTLNNPQTGAKSTPNIIYVDDDNLTGPWDGTIAHPYQNITNALTHAFTNDTIFVRNGTYHEHPTIDKSISLIGENTKNTIIDADSTSDVLSVTASGVNITGFTLQNSGQQIGDCAIQLSSNNTSICHNTIRNSYNGILLYFSSNNTILDNEIIDNEYGIQLYFCNSNLLLGNKISSNTFGMFCSAYASNNTITENFIMNNSLGTALLFGSENNTIYHNNFVNNTQQLAITDTINKFDNGIEGNYWGDYNGTDEDQNGIGNSPYIIDASNQDNYPLMGTFSDFTVIYEKHTYHVSTISNSTISHFQFNETLKMLKFNVTGINNTSGFCRITIPEKLIPWPYIVLVDDEQVNATSLPLSNATHTFLYFTYTHSVREVKILSKPYYELLENYLDLNSTFYKLLADYASLNQTLQQTLTNYTELLTNYNALNQTYQEALENYIALLEQYNALTLAHGKTESEYANVRMTLLYVSIAAIAITITTSSLTIRYRRKSQEQKKIAEKYKSELERVSLIDTARAQFKADAQRRKEKIRKFQNKYGVTVRPRDTLEDIITSLELKKEKT